MIRPEDATSEALRKCSSYQVGNGIKLLSGTMHGWEISL
jgi:hypothetical protein